MMLCGPRRGGPSALIGTPYPAHVGREALSGIRAGRRATWKGLPNQQERYAELLSEVESTALDQVPYHRGMNAPILESDDIRLVPLDLRVLDEMHVLGEDADVLRFTYVSAPFTRDDATAWIQRYVDGWAG